MVSLSPNLYWAEFSPVMCSASAHIQEFTAVSYVWGIYSWPNVIICIKGNIWGMSEIWCLMWNRYGFTSWFWIWTLQPTVGDFTSWFLGVPYWSFPSWPWKMHSIIVQGCCLKWPVLEIHKIYAYLFCREKGLGFHWLLGSHFHWFKKKKKTQTVFVYENANALWIFQTKMGVLVMDYMIQMKMFFLFFFKLGKIC